MKKSAGTLEQGNQNDLSKDIIVHHLASFGDNNLEAVLSDYTDESILVTRDAIYTGPAEIRSFFVELMKHFPKQKSSFKLDNLTVRGELAYIVWHATTPSLIVSLGSDTFILKEGKIHQQTFVGELKFIN
jgi:ketosteroid isomerase-like protein